MRTESESARGRADLNPKLTDELGSPRLWAAFPRFYGREPGRSPKGNLRLQNALQLMLNENLDVGSRRL
jgi:hypothetical protein